MPALENYYSGDENWDELEELALKEHRGVPEIAEISKRLGGNLGLACVIYATVGNGAIEWLERKIPALDNIRPLDCINDPLLIKRLREALMRFP